jgi:recombination protein RecT
MTQALTKIQEKTRNVRSLIEKSREQIAVALPRHLSAERMIRVFNTAIQKTPALLDCEPRSLIGALIQASQLGLEPDGVLGHAYLVPFNNRKTNRKECQFIPGYRGLIELARRSGQISTIYAHVVHAKDEFSYEFGLDPKLNHKPASGDAGPMVAVYAVAKLRDGGVQFEVMTKREVDEIRKRSKSSGDGPWVTDYESMAKKTVFRRICKILPVSPELTRAVSIDAYEDPALSSSAGGMADDAMTTLDVEAQPADLDEQQDVEPPHADRLAAYLEEAKDKRAVAKIRESTEQLASDGELTAEEAAELRALADQKDAFLDSVARQEAQS